MKSIFGLFLIISVGFFYGCDKKQIDPNEEVELIPPPPPPLPVIEGLYVGEFSVHYAALDTTRSDSTFVHFYEDNFTNPKNLSLLPLGGEGTFSFDSDSIAFRQYVAWPAIYDWHLYLSGKYAYTIELGHFIFHKTIGDNIYKYDLYYE